MLARPTEALALGPRPLQTGHDPLRDARALELGDRPEDVHLQLAGGCRGVDALVERHERDAKGLQLFEQRDQVAEVPSQAIQSPDDEDSLIAFTAP